MEQFNFSHRIPNALNYTAFNQEDSIQIDRIHGIRAIILEGEGVFDVINANSAVAVTTPNLLTDLRLTVGGGTVLWAGDSWGLYEINRHDYGADPLFSNLVAGTGATKAYKFVLIIDLQEVFAKAPIDTALISRLFSSIELRARIGDAATVNSNEDAEVDFVSFKINVTLDEVVNMKDGFGRFVKKVSFVERAITTAMPEFVIPLPTGNMAKKILIRSLHNNVASNAVINNIKVMVGGETLFDQTDVTNKGAKLLRKQIQTDPDGHYFIDFNPDIMISEGANLSKIASLGCNLILDVNAPTGDNLVRAMVTEILPIR